MSYFNPLVLKDIIDCKLELARGSKHDSWQRLRTACVEYCTHVVHTLATREELVDGCANHQDLLDVIERADRTRTSLHDSVIIAGRGLNDCFNRSATGAIFEIPRCVDIRDRMEREPWAEIANHVFVREVVRHRAGTQDSHEFMRLDGMSVDVILSLVFQGYSRLAYGEGRHPASDAFRLYSKAILRKNIT